MDSNKKVTRLFSGPLMRQNIRSNWVLVLAITLVMILMSTVMNYATSMIESVTDELDTSEYQEDFYTYLGALATYNTMLGGDLSYDDYISGTDTEAYEQAFAMLSEQIGSDLSVEGFQTAIDGLSQGDTDLELYVSQFEYVYALAQEEGVFSKDELSVDGMFSLILEMMGIDPDMITSISEMDTALMINRMYYTMVGLLPIFILIVILGNSVIASQVDRGSMAYVLSTPTKRTAVAFTQMLFMVLVPLVVIALVAASRVGTTYAFYGEVTPSTILALYGGMYILVESICGICYLASCWFSQSKYSIGVGGGLTVWFFLAAMIGMFGSEEMVSVGMGVEELSVFNKLTLIGLYDVDALSTVGTGDVDYTFVWKLCILAGVAVAAYVAGAIRFKKKDLPL